MEIKNAQIKNTILGMNKQKDYEFHIGDEVITIEGVKGKITSICKCKYCEERGFYELFWENEYNKVEECITIYDMEDGFSRFYKIAKYRFNDFNKGEVLQEIENCKNNLKRLRKQLKIIKRR